MPRDTASDVHALWAFAVFTVVQTSRAYSRKRRDRTCGTSQAAAQPGPLIRIIDPYSNPRSGLIVKREWPHDEMFEISVPVGTNLRVSRQAEGVRRGVLQ